MICISKKINKYVGTHYLCVSVEAPVHSYQAQEVFIAPGRGIEDCADTILLPLKTKAVVVQVIAIDLPYHIILAQCGQRWSSGVNNLFKVALDPILLERVINCCTFLKISGCSNAFDEIVLERWGGNTGD